MDMTAVVLDNAQLERLYFDLCRVRRFSAPPGCVSSAEHSAVFRVSSAIAISLIVNRSDHGTGQQIRRFARERSAFFGSERTTESFGA